MTSRNDISPSWPNRWRAAAAGLLLMAAGLAAPPAQAGADCVVIDTDFDIDDMMAIPTVIGNRHVAAIVTTEGYTRAEAGAAALARLIAEPDQRPIPIIIGANTDRTAAEIAENWPWLPYVRRTMSRLNDFLAAPPTPPGSAPRDYVRALTDATTACARLDVLIIGTYSSFIHYSAALRPKIEHVVVMGKPIGDPSQRPGKTSFNCGYDLPACQTAMGQLAQIQTAWIDIPRDSEPPYEPSLAMVEGLREEGLPGTLKAALLANQHSWNPTKVAVAAGGPGGHALLWDQSAAIYLLRPDLFAPVGGHYEPRPIDGSHARIRDELRRVWTQATNAAVHYQ